ncbi:RNA-directed DNA polymerase [Rhodopila globiformis]|nr:RNA-directed DNA polymerase [Rhodopila globiformis]
MGLPVGPDTSRVVAEIVAVAVDVDFATKHKGKEVSLIRHVDDVWIGASSMDEAEAYLYSYRECLRDYGLDINELKTSITESSEALDPTWPLSLKMMIKNDFGGLNTEDKTKVLSEIFRMSSREKDDGIIKYAIRRFDREKMWRRHWNVLEDFLVRCVNSFPHSIDYVSRVVAYVNRTSTKVQLDKWQKVILISLNRNSSIGNDSEVCWLLWLMKELGLNLPVQIIDIIIARCGVFAIVTACYLNPNAIRRSPQRRQKLLTQIGDSPFSGAFWLLAYEAVVGRWIPDADLPRATMSEFLSKMAAAKVSFFDPAAVPFFIHPTDDDVDDRYNDYAIKDMAGRYDDGGDDGESGNEDKRYPWQQHRSDDDIDYTDSF